MSLITTLLKHNKKNVVSSSIELLEQFSVGLCSCVSAKVSIKVEAGAVEKAEK
jgi:hypothetical protein